jgi:hypothetical protein
LESLAIRRILIMTTWGLRREYELYDRNGWFWMLWEKDYKQGRGYRPLAGDRLKVWDKGGTGRVYEGPIIEARSFVYSSHGEVKMALGGVAERDMPYFQSRPTSGWCIAVRSELVDVAAENCPIEGQNSWKQLT